MQLHEGDRLVQVLRNIDFALPQKQEATKKHMRSNQQKSRSRSRNNSNRSRNTNPLQRSYESNGPEVRVRGNAAHVAEKYVQLSRDAHQTGDSVAAENYLQHAEHYFRIISAAQAQIQTQQIAQQAQHAQQQARQAENAPAGNGDSVPAEKANEVVASPENVSLPETEEVGSNTSTSTDAAPAVSTVGENAPRPPKRPRRRTRTQEKPANEQSTSVEAKEEGSNSSDPADAPQPEVGLPSFVTAGSETKAAE